MKKQLKKYKYKIIFILAAIIVITVVFALFSVDNITNSKNIEYISSFGWVTETSPKDISHLTIPEELNALYKTYSDTASIDGSSLSEYCGKNVTRYSYRVLNHKLSSTGRIRADVFVYKSQIIAADITDLSKNGKTISISDTTDLNK